MALNVILIIVNTLTTTSMSGDVEGVNGGRERGLRGEDDAKELGMKFVLMSSGVKSTES